VRLWPDQVAVGLATLPKHYLSPTRLPHLHDTPPTRPRWRQRPARLPPTPRPVHQEQRTEPGRRWSPTLCARRQDSSRMSSIHCIGFGLDASSQQQAAQAKPITFTIDTHHLFYILIRSEALGINVGTLDVKLENPSRPTSYINFASSDKADTLSLSSFRSSLLQSRTFHWARAGGANRPPSIDVELKYIYSNFTNSLHFPYILRAPRSSASLRTIRLTMRDPPGFIQNLQSLECIDIDPRVFWAGMGRRGRAKLTISAGYGGRIRCVHGLVLDDQATREARDNPQEERVSCGPPHQGSFHTRLPDSSLKSQKTHTQTRNLPMPLSYLLGSGVF